MKKYILAFCLTWFHVAAPEQYLYPVADLEDGEQLLLLYQKSLHDIEIWAWDAFNKTAQKALLSFYSPANLRLLPSKEGFSFIDQGRIRIKNFNRRSPKTIDIYQPISSISSMEWIDDNNFYFVAREGDFYQVFQGNDLGDIKRLTYEKEVDFLYPQKVDSQLFCIRRDLDRNFEIVYLDWQPDSFYNRQNNLNYTSVVKLHKPVCFLHMINENEGFYLEYSGFRSENSQTYAFSCYRIVNEDGNWRNQYLFQFKLPVDAISGNSSTRLYESLEPFLPNYTCKDNVYFVSYDQNRKSFGMYKYEIPTKNMDVVYKPIQKSHPQNEYFVPFRAHGKVYCGMIVKDLRKADFLIQNSMTGDINFELPSFDDIDN